MIYDLNESIKIVESVAKKYYKIAKVEYEDMVQDLWVKVLEISKNAESSGTTDIINNPRFLRVSLDNCAKNICRTNWNIQNHKIDFDNDELTDEEIDAYYYKHSAYTDDFSNLSDLIMTINKLDGRLKNYVVAKSVLNGNMKEYNDEYEIILESLPQEKIDEFNDYSKHHKSSKFSDKIIVNTFCGIKSGGYSEYKMKNELKKLLID